MEIMTPYTQSFIFIFFLYIDYYNWVAETKFSPIPGKQDLGEINIETSMDK